MRHPKASPEEIAHLAYLLIKESGICVRCHQSWAKKDRVLCQDCIDYWNGRAICTCDNRGETRPCPLHEGTYAQERRSKRKVKKGGRKYARRKVVA